MFTGLVEKTGLLKSKCTRGQAATLTIAHDPWSEPARMGDSVAVQGACLTVTGIDSGSFSCDALLETMLRTTLGAMMPDTPVNLERALRAGDRMGGHIVSGHVDGIGEVVSTTFTGDDWIIRVACETEVQALLVPKGSVACDGVSLTVVDVLSDGFTTHIIPHTWSATTLGRLQPGTRVNLEGDLLAKYARRAVADILSSRDLHPNGNVTEETLRQAGF